MARRELSDFDKYARYQISENLKKFSHGITQKDLSKQTGIPASTLSGYFARRSTPNAGALEKIADALNVKKSDIDPRYKMLEKEESIGSAPESQKVASAHNVVSLPQLTIVQIPILGTIACGEPVTAEQNVEGYTHELFDEQPTGTLFALRCKGDSMEPLIPDGSIVLIHQQPTVEDGEIAAVLVDDNNEATLKRVKHTGDQIMLIPENKKYDPILLNKENPGRILGKAVHVDFKL